MLKRIAALSLVMVFVLALVGLQVSSSLAAPADQTIASAPNANLLPSDTALYFDFRTNQISDVVKFIQNVNLQVTGKAMPDPFQDIDKSLSDALGRSASWAKDIAPWLGDHFTVGLSMSDKQLNALQAGGFPIPDVVAVLAVKNSTKADEFFKEIMTKANPSASSMKATQDKIGNTSITIYSDTSSSGANRISLVQAPTYFAFGSASGIAAMIDTLKTRKPTLAADANFGKIIRALKPNNLVTVYLPPRLYELSMSMSSALMMMPNPEGDQMGTPEATPQANAQAATQTLFKAINGQAFGLGRNGKLLYLDVVQSINQDAAAKAYASMNLPTDFLTKFSTTPISTVFTAQIPADALFVVQAHGLADIYSTLKTASQNMPAMPPSSGGMRGAPDFSQLAQSFNQIESAFRLGLGVDLQKDVLIYMNSDFAVYLSYDPNSTLAKLDPNKPNPFVYTLLAKTSDVTKTKDFLTKLSDGLKSFGKLTVTSAGTDLYTATANNGATFSFGLVGKTFLLTVGCDPAMAVTAIKGTGSLVSSPIWAQAAASGVNPTTQFWYLNTNELSAVLKAQLPADQMNSTDAKQAFAFLNLFNSATITSSPIGKDGISRGSIDLIMK